MPVLRKSTIVLALLILITAVGGAGIRDKTLPTQTRQNWFSSKALPPGSIAFVSGDSLSVRRAHGIQEDGHDSISPARPDGRKASTSEQVRPVLQSAVAKELEARSSNRLASRGSSNVVSLGNFIVTAYTNSPNDTGKAVGDTGYGITASGNPARVGVTIAADWSVLPEGTVVEIEDLPGTFVVQDKGSAVNGRHIDLFVPSESAALAWGVKRRKITVLKWGSVHE